LPEVQRLVQFLLRIYTRVSKQTKGQSCAIAALSGSTNESFEEAVKNSGGGKQPQGSNSKGKQCITKYYKQLGLKAPVGISRSVNSERVGAASEMFRRGSVNVEKRQNCKQNILLFARGTTEPGTMGSTVGPALSSALSRQGGGKWRSEGVKYAADVAGDDCIGFPGGIKCRDQLAKIATSCPTSNFFISGYSEGAMVAHICTAFSTDDVKKRIKVRLNLIPLSDNTR
jgi:hypothetical protein